MERKLTQGDIEDRTGLLRCYVSRVERGHTVPSLETLAKFAAALEVPLNRLFYDGEQPPDVPSLLKRGDTEGLTEDMPERDARFFRKIVPLIGKMNERNRRLLLYTAQKLANRY